MSFHVHVPHASFDFVSPYAGAREIWLILEERERIDAIDEQEGQKVQDMVRGGRAVFSVVGSSGCEQRVES